MSAHPRSRRLLVLVPTPREADLIFGEKAHGLGAPRIVGLAGRSVRVALTGLGLAAAGSTAGSFLARVAPDAVALAGIAGTFDPLALPIGALLQADTVACDGVGAGEGERFAALPEPPLPGTLTEGADLAAIRLRAPADSGTDASRPLASAVRGGLLSVASCAASFSMAEARRKRHPGALAEDMEGYAVALAALVNRVPLQILRGISNVAGDRDHSRWRLEPALERCRAALIEWAETTAG